MKVLFVCTGNSCRSVIAEYLFKKIIKDFKKEDIEVYSAGTHAVVGAFPFNEAIKAMQEQGIDISSHESKQLTLNNIKGADVIYVMKEAHREWILDKVPQAANKVKLLKEEGIDDPIGKSLDEYRKSIREIKDCLIKIIDEI